MVNREPGFWLRESARAGLPTNDQRELLASLAHTVGCRARYFPSAPLPYLARVKQLLMSTFFPQKGPILITLDPAFPPERLSRSQAWQIAHWELSHLEGASRPVRPICRCVPSVRPVRCVPSHLELSHLERVANYSVRCHWYDGPKRFSINRPSPLALRIICCSWSGSGIKNGSQSVDLDPTFRP